MGDTVKYRHKVHKKCSVCFSSACTVHIQCIQSTPSPILDSARMSAGESMMKLCHVYGSFNLQYVHIITFINGVELFIASK